MKFKPNRKENGEFATKHYISRRQRTEELKGKVIAFVMVASLVVCFALGVVQIGKWGIHELHVGWERLVAHQVELRDRAWEIAMPQAMAYEEQESFPYVPYVPEIVPKAIADEFVEYAEKYNVPKDKMARIMQAESSFRSEATHKNKKGLGTDHGLCQVNDVFWKKELSKKGIPFASLESCFYIYSQVGDTAWKASEKRWAY